MSEKARGSNPFSAGLEEWEHPLGKLAQPQVKTRGATRTKGPLQVAGAAPASVEPAPIPGGDSFRKGLDAWEDPLGKPLRPVSNSDADYDPDTG